MANILDIFRTYSGKKLIERAQSETKLSDDELKRSFSVSLPIILAVFHKNDDLINRVHALDNTSFIDHLEKNDLIKSGEDVFGKLELEINKELQAFDNIMDLQKNDSTKIFNISAAVVFKIVSEIKENEPKAKISEIIESLLGLSSAFEKAFINCIVKNPNSAGIIDPSEKIFLGDEEKGGDQSIIGGYSGGR